MLIQNTRALLTKLDEALEKLQHEPAETAGLGGVAASILDVFDESTGLEVCRAAVALQATIDAERGSAAVYRRANHLHQELSCSLAGGRCHRYAS